LSRVLVIDIDTKPGNVNGWESIFDLMEEYAPLPETTSGITPSGGMHLYHAMPKGEPSVESGVAAERPHPVAGAGASDGRADLVDLRPPRVQATDHRTATRDPSLGAGAHSDQAEADRSQIYGRKL
jgi:Bifunctional DNA primase/polymerase, N-terminal